MSLLPCLYLEAYRFLGYCIGIKTSQLKTVLYSLSCSQLDMYPVLTLGLRLDLGIEDYCVSLGLGPVTEKYINVVILGTESGESVVASFCNCKCEHWRPSCMCLPAAQNCCRT